MKLTASALSEPEYAFDFLAMILSLLKYSLKKLFYLIVKIDQLSVETIGLILKVIYLFFCICVFTIHIVSC